MCPAVGLDLTRFVVCVPDFPRGATGRGSKDLEVASTEIAFFVGWSGPAAPFDTIRRMVNPAIIYLASEFWNPDMIVRFVGFVNLLREI